MSHVSSLARLETRTCRKSTRTMTSLWITAKRIASQVQPGQLGRRRRPGRCPFSPGDFALLQQLQRRHRGAGAWPRDQPLREGRGHPAGWRGGLVVGPGAGGRPAVRINGTEVAVFKPGVFVGEMCLWFGGTRQGDMVAKTSGVIATVLFLSCASGLRRRAVLPPQSMRAAVDPQLPGVSQAAAGLPDDHPPITEMPVSAGEISIGWNKLCT